MTLLVYFNNIRQKMFLCALHMAQAKEFSPSIFKVKVSLYEKFIYLINLIDEALVVKKRPYSLK